MMEQNSRKHYKIKVKGRVQGVFFRVSTKDKADELGIRGTVQNLPDGSVYIECEGNEAAMNDFIAWCRKGPEMARVDELDITEAGPKNFEGFSILH